MLAGRAPISHKFKTMPRAALCVASLSNDNGNESMTIHFGQVGKTVKQAVTADDASWLDPAMPDNPAGMWLGHYVIQSDQAIHFDVGATASPDSSPRLPANLPVEITMQDQDAIHFILAAGSTDCSIWITKKA